MDTHDDSSLRAKIQAVVLRLEEKQQRQIEHANKGYKDGFVFKLIADAYEDAALQLRAALASW